jgi:hypothetical protein
MSKFIRRLWLVALLAVMTGIGTASQIPEGKAQPDEAQLKDRAKLFYQNLLKNDRVSALELVATDSKNQFLNNKYSGLVDFRIVGVAMEQSGERATVHVVRVTKVPHVGQPMDLDVNDTWQRSNEQWYLVLPPPGELDTPFGKMKVGTDGQQSSPEAEAMRQKLQERYKNVDPDQYLHALQKVIVNSDSPAAKPTDKQQAQPATTTQDDKPKAQP